MNKKEKLKKVIEILEGKYGEVQVMLNYSSTFELLVAVILSAQCTDKRVNIVTEHMFKYVNTPEEFAKMPLEEIEVFIRSTGFYKNKAKNIKACSQKILKEHQGQVPLVLSELVQLAGVGRKTANVVMGAVLGKPQGIVVDTHVKRLSNRIGFVDSDNPIIIERELMKFIPKKYWFKYPNLLIHHGRSTCIARKPRCQKCEINIYCSFNR